MLVDLTDEVDGMQEQKGSVSREKKVLRKKQKQMLWIKMYIIVTEMMNAFDGLIS